MIVVVHFTTCCLCQQVTSLVVLGKRYLRSWRSLPPPPWSCFPCHRCPGRPPGEVRRSEGAAFLLNLVASCSSFSCLAVSAPASARASSSAISSSAGRTSARRTQGRDGEEVLGARSLGFYRSQQSAPPFLLEQGWLGCWRSL